MLPTLSSKGQHCFKRVCPASPAKSQYEVKGGGGGGV